MLDLAYAGVKPPGGGGGGDTWGFIVMMLAMFAIFYFLILRPQQKQRKERDGMLRSVKKGDRVVTTSGLHGTVTALTEQTLTLRIADQVKVEFDRTAIGRVVTPGAEKDAAS
jgi:preprotein translocase subunit YajC